MYSLDRLIGKGQKLDRFLIFRFDFLNICLCPEGHQPSSSFFSPNLFLNENQRSGILFPLEKSKHSRWTVNRKRSLYGIVYTREITSIVLLA
jgi:hypothetical protein